MRWLGPVTAFDELPELELAGRLGWHTVEAGMLCHRMVRTDTQWEHKRVVWPGSLARNEREGWQIGCRAFPWVYLIRDLGVPAEPEHRRDRIGGSPAYTALASAADSRLFLAASTDARSAATRSTTSACSCTSGSTSSGMPSALLWTSVSRASR